MASQLPRFWWVFCSWQLRKRHRKGGSCDVIKVFLISWQLYVFLCQSKRCESFIGWGKNSNVIFSWWPWGPFNNYIQGLKFIYLSLTFKGEKQRMLNLMDDFIGSDILNIDPCSTHSDRRKVSGKSLILCPTNGMSQLNEVFHPYEI